MKKIAVCLPSYNEKDNIQNITKLVDEALCELGNNYDCIIINCDNCSQDCTNNLFMDTKTFNKKYTILCPHIGKGFNIINFMDYCFDNEIDYAFMFDTDLISFKKDWIKKYLKELQNNDFVIPLYKRKRYEGNTTNHFVFPLIYSLYGIFIRQPIGGDYGFTKKYISIFKKQVKNEFVKSYGIDIFMVLLALKKVKIGQVRLDEKIHSPSDNKKTKIFSEVLNSFTNSYKYYNKIKNINLKFNKDEIRNYNSISSKIDNDFYEKNILKNDYPEFKIVYIKWKNILLEYIKRINNNSYCGELDNELTTIFDLYTLLFWHEFHYSTSLECENHIYKLAEELKNELEEIKKC